VFRARAFTRDSRKLAGRVHLLQEIMDAVYELKVQCQRFAQIQQELGQMARELKQM
jgi:hypothetical protein